ARLGTYASPDLAFPETGGRIGRNFRAFHAAGLVPVKGEGATITVGPTKTGRPRVVDIDDTTLALLKPLRRERGALVLAYARDDALVFSDHEGRVRHPERFSRVFAETAARGRATLARMFSRLSRCTGSGTLMRRTACPG